MHRYISGLGGRVVAVNRREGGARVLVTLPGASPDDPRTGEAPTGSEGSGVDLLQADAMAREGSNGASSDPNSEANTRLQQAQPEGPEGHGHATRPGEPSRGLQPLFNGEKVLVVEDEAALRNLEVRLLQRAGAEPRAVGTVEEARHVLEAGPVNAILCDIKMPGESGLDFYRWLEREHPELTERFLFVTGDVSGDELTELEKANPGLFIHKPFDTQELVRRVAAVARAPDPTGSG